MTKTGVLKTISALSVVVLLVAAIAAFSSNESNAQENDTVTVTETVDTNIESTTSTPTSEETVVIESTTTQQTELDSDTNVTDVDAMMQDRVLGDANAPVTVIEYASMTCIHCANFHNNNLDEMMSELIDTGKVKYIFREFPLDAVALRASMMARCAPEDKFFGLLEVLFANQKRWVGAQNPINAMTKMGKLAGLSDAEIDACLANKDLETALLETRQTAQTEFNVRSTPTFVFNNGEAVESGVLPVSRIEEIIETLD
tara:strand:- start:475 stop:1248 length:774 start_codon:yes stop_codon:yes gene_type:complete